MTEIRFDGSNPLWGNWQLFMDAEPCVYSEPPAEYPLTMTLPGTTAQQKLGAENPVHETGFLTELYPFRGQLWLKKILHISETDLQAQRCLLYLERTRMTQLWINGQYAGSEQSLCTPHVYDISGLLTPETEIVLCIRNTGYPVPGGHMTSPDTQTNWIGVTGRMELQFSSGTQISDLRVYPDAAAHRIRVTGRMDPPEPQIAETRIMQNPYPQCGGWHFTVPKGVLLAPDASGEFSAEILLPPDAPQWSEQAPVLLAVDFELPQGEIAFAEFGLRDFKACGDHFELNGKPVMLRGRHDAMTFPLTGAAPTSLEMWLRYFQCMQTWGINHIRFHTCCPPEAAFAAADLAGIFLEPELPFWGTVDAEGGEKYDAVGQAYLLREGRRICDAFGNHPSFVMLSLGNELWGSTERLGEMLDTLRAHDPRPLYTQGSNNFQFTPQELPQEDFWVGVRTGRHRLLRGSYADCDAPLGRIQMAAPSASWDYSAALQPAEADISAAEAEITVQHGTGVAHVKAAAQQQFNPTKPVITHEIGQYNIYPDYRELPKYTGVLAPRNLGVFRERLVQAGMGEQAADFFRCSGKLARDCYKSELEAVMRTPQIAGFQLLDLQDFPGQGTALVGMLNAFLESKGLIEPAAWRAFCGDLVPLAIFDSYVQESGSIFHCRYAIRSSRPEIPAQPFRVTFTVGDSLLAETVGEIPASGAGLIDLGGGGFRIPEKCIGNAKLTFELPESDICNTWELTILPPAAPVTEEIVTVRSFTEAEPHLQRGEAVLLIPAQITDKIRGFYCTDFWNYPMFRSISESMGRQVPVGTMGLCIDKTHPVARALFSDDYSTPQWYSIVTHADCAVLDDAPNGYRPAVQMIDNVERNHRLGLLFETAVGGGRLFVCTARLTECPEDPCMNRLHHAIAAYMQSDAFAPAETLSAGLLRKLFC